MPKYIYGLFAVVLLVITLMGVMVWVEFSQLQQSRASASGGSMSGDSGQTGDAPDALQSKLEDLFLSSQSAQHNTGVNAPANSGYNRNQYNNLNNSQKQQAQHSTNTAPVAQVSAQQQPHAAHSNGNSNSGAQAVPPSAPAQHPAGQNASANPAQKNSAIGSTQSFVQKTPSAGSKGASGQIAPDQLPSAGDDPAVDGGKGARTMSVFKTQPATNKTGALAQAQKVGDDSAKIVEQNTPPAIEKKKTEINVIPEWEYGLSDELPELGKSLPGRTSTEMVTADILCEQLRAPVLPKLAEPKPATGDAALRNRSRQWVVNIRPSWCTTDYSTGDDKPSSKIARFGLRSDISYKFTKLELTGSPWIEKTNVSGAAGHDSFNRMGVSLSTVYRVMKQENQKPLDLSVGMNLFAAYTMGDYSYVDSMIQTGGGIGVDARRKLLDFIVLGAGVGWQRSNRELGDLPGNMNLFDLSAYAGLQLGKNLLLTPGVTMYNGQNENLPSSTWTDVTLDLAYAVNPKSVIGATVGFHSDPLKTWFIRTNFGLKF